MMMRPGRNCVVYSVLVLICLFVPALLAAETDGQAGSDSAEKQSDDGRKLSPAMQATGGKPGKGEVAVYTNQDLQRMFGPAEPSAGSSGPDAVLSGSTDGGRDPLEELFRAERLRTERRGRLPAAQQAVTDARERVKRMERRVLASKNPLLARPAPPEDQDAAQAWRESGAAGRVSMAQQELDAARTELAEVEQTLRNLRSSQ